MQRNPFLSSQQFQEADMHISESQQIDLSNFNRFPSVVNIDPAFKLKQESKFTGSVDDPETPKLCPNLDDQQSNNSRRKASSRDEEMSSS